MNIVTYKRILAERKSYEDRITEAMAGCKTYEQLASVIEFNLGYLKASIHFDNIRKSGRELTDRMIKLYFTRMKNKARD